MRSKLIRHPLNRAPQMGATMVEAAMTFTFLLMLVGGIIDFGFGIHRYNQLRHVLSSETLKAVLGKCPDKTETINAVQTKLQNVFGEVSGEPTFQILAPSEDLHRYNMTLQVSGSIPMNCFFCALTGLKPSLSATSEQFIEASGCVPT